MSLQIVFDSLQRLPGVLTAFKQSRVLGLAEVEEVRRFEHGATLGETPEAAKR